MLKIQTLNNISVHGLERLPRDRFEIASELVNPDAILVRSADMHKLEIPASVKAIGRAGAGTNNIPVAALSKRGVPVFNAPRSEEHTSELQSLIRNSYAVFCLKKK